MFHSLNTKFRGIKTRNVFISERQKIKTRRSEQKIQTKKKNSFFRLVLHEGFSSAALRVSNFKKQKKKMVKGRTRTRLVDKTKPFLTC